MRLGTAVVVAVVATVLTAVPAHAAGEYDNVIVMVPDGCSQSVVTAARWYKGEALAVDEWSAGMMSTYMKNSVITGSAAAATAFATGHKTTVRFIGVGPRAEDVLSTEDVPPEEMQYKPLATVLEGAKLQGKATGLISTSRITHATPASYAAHIQDRGWDNEIMEHLVYQDINVVLGGGRRHLIPEAGGGRRTDGENLVQVLRDRGYEFVNGKIALEAASGPKVWGMFDDSHMEAEIDRLEFAPQQPSIADMTSKALEILSQDPDGFFLMVEGSQVDWAGHANDPIYMITDFLAFDDAVAEVLDFASNPANGNTLVLIFPDHNTGALAIGSYYQQVSYTETKVEDLIGPLEGMKLSAYGVARKLGDDTSTENIKAQVKTWWGIDLTDEDLDAIFALVDSGLSFDYALSEYVSATYTVFGWTTHGHTGEDVPVWTYASDGNRPFGQFDNTDMALIAADAMGFSLDAVDSMLYIEAMERWPGATMDMTDPENPVLKVGSSSLPASKDLLYYQPMDLTLQMGGLTVHAPETGKCYIPFLAAVLIDGLEGQGTALKSIGGLRDGMTVDEALQALGYDRDWIRDQVKVVE
jgi:alkaline phosphatase